MVTLFAAPPGTRRGPTRTTKTHQTAPRAPPPRALRTRTASRHPSPGVRRRTISPTSVNWPFPPREERGSGLIPNCAGHQAVDYRRGAPRRRSLKPGRRPRQPATSRQGARRGAHRRPPHPRPTTTDSTVTLGSRTRPASELIMRIHCGRLAPPLGLAGGKDTAAVPWRPPRINDIPNLVTNPVVCLGAESLRVRRPLAGHGSRVSPASRVQLPGGSCTVVVCMSSREKRRGGRRRTRAGSISTAARTTREHELTLLLMLKLC